MLKPIKTEEQYKEYLKRIYALMQKDIKTNSKDSAELETLSILVKNYEKAHYPIEKPIKTFLEEMKIRFKSQEDIIISEEIKQSVLEGIKDAKEGRLISSEEVMKALGESDSLEDFNNDFDESEWTW